MPPRLECPAPVWHELIGELHRRGGERTESGALLLGRVDPSTARKIVRAIYYDDIDPNALVHGYVYLDRREFGKVWRECREGGLRVVADVHTHPGLALQSPSDRTNPIIPRIGHLAIIVPNYSISPVDLGRVGVFEYLGSDRWRTLSDQNRPTETIQMTASI